MKTKFFVAALVALVIVCAGLSVLFLRPSQGATAVRVISDGQVKQVLSLSENTRLEIVTTHGTNVVEVKDGKVAVTQADCPDHYCMDRGWCSGGAQIVCLPNRLVLEFVGSGELDAVTG